MIILPEIPQGRRTSPWRRQMDVVERILTNATLSEPTRRSHTGKKQTIMVNNHPKIMAWCTTSMMHDRFNEARHGKVHKQTYKFKWSTICIGMHIDKTPHQLFSSLLFMYPTILNVIKHGKRWNMSKIHSLAFLNEAGNIKQQFR